MVAELVAQIAGAEVEAAAGGRGPRATVAAAGRRARLPEVQGREPRGLSRRAQRARRESSSSARRGGRRAASSATRRRTPSSARRSSRPPATSAAARCACGCRKRRGRNASLSCVRYPQCRGVRWFDQRARSKSPCARRRPGRRARVQDADGQARPGQLRQLLLVLPALAQRRLGLQRQAHLDQLLNSKRCELSIRGVGA